MRIFLSKIKDFLTPKPIEATSTREVVALGGCYAIDKDEYCVTRPLPAGLTEVLHYKATKTPFITDVSHRMLYQLATSQDMQAGEHWLRTLGYRKYDLDPSRRMIRYARPFSLWLLLRGAMMVQRMYWWVMRTTWRRLWHQVPGTEAYLFSWRHVRPGPWTYWEYRYILREWKWRVIRRWRRWRNRP